MCLKKLIVPTLCVEMQPGTLCVPIGINTEEIFMNAAVDVLQSSHQHINRDRLWASLMDLAKLGATAKGGVCRLALTDLDRQARDLFVQWCKEAGCSVTVDAVGN